MSLTETYFKKTFRRCALCLFQGTLCEMSFREPSLHYTTQLEAGILSHAKTQFQVECSGSHEYDWISRYFHAVPSDTDLNEVVDFLMSTREYLKEQGHPVPKLSRLCKDLETTLTAHGVRVDPTLIQEIYCCILHRETRLSSRDSELFHTPLRSTQLGEICAATEDSINEKQGAKTHAEMAIGIGFCKFLAGALCCISAHLPLQIIGAGMLINGIVNLMQHIEYSPTQQDLEGQVEPY